MVHLMLKQLHHRISGSYGGECEDSYLLGCIALIMEAASTSETLVNFYQTIRRYDPEDSHLQLHHNLDII
jgi:hypothetical protein